PRNELTVEVEAPDNRGGLWGEVALEVRCTAYLRSVRWWVDDGGRLHVLGEVAGASERPLELYALVDDKTIIYATVEAAPLGQPFRFVSDAPIQRKATVPHEVRVELVNGATVWYRVEGTCLSEPEV